MYFALLCVLPVLLISPLFTSAACSDSDVRKRVEWRTFSDEQKQAYIDAVLCLQNSTSQSGYEGAVTRFDDFQAAHIRLAPIIHRVGQFLPWHRYLIWAYETKLIEECGYNGTQPYWDEIKDSNATSKSPLLDGSDLSFGGKGEGPDGCVKTGPFANYTLHLGPGEEVTDHCLARNVTDNVIGVTQAVVDDCLAYNSFNETNLCISLGPNDTLTSSCQLFFNSTENAVSCGPHPAGHFSVGAVMTDTYGSPGDPIFYAHHSYVDKLWSDWQNIDKEARIVDIGGYTTQIPANGSTEGLEITTLDYVLDMNQILPNVTVIDTMDTTGGTLCYVYV